MSPEIRLGVDPSEPEVGAAAIIRIEHGEFSYRDVISGNDEGWRPIDPVTAIKFIAKDRIARIKRL